MAAGGSQVMLVGHIFIRRLHPDHLWELGSNVHVALRGFGGLTVPGLVSRLESVLQPGQFDIVYLDIGTNDLAAPRNCSARQLVDEILILAASLVTHFRVGHVVIGVPIPRHGIALNSVALDYNVRVTQMNQLLTATVRHDGRISIWRLRQLNSPRFICRDGVHFNAIGLNVYYRSLRGAVLTALRATCHSSP